MLRHLSYLLRSGKRTRMKERGITGLETAIVLIAFVVVSSVFAFSVLSTGLFSSDQARLTIQSGLKETQGTLSLRGAVIAKDSDGDGTDVDELQFYLANAAGGEVDMTPGRASIRYTDKYSILTRSVSGQFVVTPQGSANSGALLESGELFLIRIPNLATALSPVLGTNTSFRIEIIPANGAVLELSRSTPATLATLMALAQ